MHHGAPAQFHTCAASLVKGFDLQLTQYDDSRLACDPSTRPGETFAHERDGHRVGAHAVASDAAGGVEKVGRRNMPSDNVGDAHPLQVRIAS
jgi:hypothetical protein